MKTKHLLFATALVASFAACTNDDFSFEGQQNVAADGRPTVSGVKINFQGDADTRVAFGKDGYAWESDDVIGALLMDNVKALGEDKTWLEKYSLVPYIHTSYPFSYNKEDKTWGCNTKMLEGNYFFAYPWESYEGQRKVNYSLVEQTQTGVKGSVVAEAYANNQFFIGYSQIMAGTQATDVLNDVEMYPILGAIQLRIVNTGTQTRHINKIVLSGDGLQSTFTFDPTKAEYTGYNLNNSMSVVDGAENFNYANYTGNETDWYSATEDTKVFNADKNYYKGDAIRAVVDFDGVENSSKLVINGTTEERELKSNAGNTAYALIMATPGTFEENNNSKELKLSIYTDEGMVANIDLTKINKEIDTANGVSAITDSKVEEIAPNVSNTIKVQIDDNSFNIPEEMDIYTEDDLLQFIKWNTTIAGKRDITATFKEDITLSKKMVELLNGKENLTLTVAASNNKVTLAADVPADVLEMSKLDIDAEAIEMLGKLSLTEETQNIDKLIVAEGATLTINDAKANIANAIENNGTLEIGEDATIAVSATTITNNGVMTVAKGADVKAEVTNMAELTNNGYMSNVVENGSKCTITMGEGANLTVATNNGEIISAKDAQVKVVTNSGEIKVVEGAKVDATGGVIYREVAGAVAHEATGSKVNTWVVTADASFAQNDKKANPSIKNLVVVGKATITVADKATLNVTELMAVEANTTVKGNVTAKKVQVEKGITLTNNGVIDASQEGVVNEGTVYNNGKVIFPTGTTGDNLTPGNWKYNAGEAKTETPAEAEVVECEASFAYGYGNNNYSSELNRYSTGDVEVLNKLCAEGVKDEVNNKIYKANKILMGGIDLAVVDAKYITTLNACISKLPVTAFGEIGVPATTVLAFKELAVGAEGNLKFTSTRTKTVGVTVGKISVATGRELDVNGMWIELICTEKAQEGIGSNFVLFDGNFKSTNNNGALVSKTAAGEYLTWDVTNKNWKKIQ